MPFGEFGEISWKLLTRKSRLPNCKVSHPHLMHKTSLVWYHWRWYTDGFRTSSVIVRKGLLLRVFHPMLHQWFLESHKGPYLAHAFSCFTLMTLLLASPLLDCLQMTLCYCRIARTTPFGNSTVIQVLYCLVIICC